MKEETIAFIDVETTGLLPHRHEVIEFACLLAMQESSNSGGARIKIIEEYEIKMSPQYPERADQIALKINGYNLSTWLPLTDRSQGLSRIAQLLTVSDPNDKYGNKIVLAGQNVQFDIAFLLEEFSRAGIAYPFGKRSIDLWSAARMKFKDEIANTRFSLQALCERYGIVNDHQHTAMGDTRAAYEVYKKLFEVKENTQAGLF